VRALLFARALFAALLVAGGAPAAPGETPSNQAPKQNAISFEPLAILSRGFLIQYERLFGDRLSAVLGPGIRLAAREDFSSETLVLHGEARYWVARRELISREPGMVGPLAALAVDFGRTSVRSLSQDRSLGAMLTLQESARFGYRFVIFGFQEITPSFGLNLVHEFDERGRLAATTRFTVSANLTVGWLF
jgi:hypothetical protein